MIENPQRVFSKKRSLYGSNNIPLPTVFTIHPTNICNHKCSYCYFSHGNQELNIDDTLNILRYLDNQTEIKEVVVSGGGEPLLHKDIRKLFENFNRYKHIHRRLYTNGHLLHSHLDLIANSFDYVRVSLDAGNANTYAHLHNVHPKNFEIIIQNMQLLSISNNSIDVYASFVLNELNFSEAALLVEIAKDNNISGVVFKSLLNKKGWRSGLAASLKIPKKNDIKVIVRQEQKQTTQCTPLPTEFSSINIVSNYDGFIYPCCHLTTQEYRIARNTISDFKKKYGSHEHLRILQLYENHHHSCRAYDLWDVCSNQ